MQGKRENTLPSPCVLPEHLQQSLARPESGSPELSPHLLYGWPDPNYLSYLCHPRHALSGSCSQQGVGVGWFKPRHSENAIHEI